MIGLQTKRLSGAQWKRLTRERKMREGTWTEKKPPRKTPSSQDTGAVGSSGGVKRPHSDSSTPSLEKQQPRTLPQEQSDWGIGLTIFHPLPRLIMIGPIPLLSLYAFMM